MPEETIVHHGERITRLEVLAEKTEQAMRDLHGEIHDVRREISNNFRVMVGIQFTTLVAIAGLFARSAHWL